MIDHGPSSEFPVFQNSCNSNSWYSWWICKPFAPQLGEGNLTWTVLPARYLWPSESSPSSTKESMRACNFTAVVRVAPGAQPVAQQKIVGSWWVMSVCQGGEHTTPPPPQRHQEQKHQQLYHLVLLVAPNCSPFEGIYRYQWRPTAPSQQNWTWDDFYQFIAGSQQQCSPWLTLHLDSFSHYDISFTIIPQIIYDSCQLSRVRFITPYPYHSMANWCFLKIRVPPVIIQFINRL